MNRKTLIKILICIAAVVLAWLALHFLFPVRDGVQAIRERGVLRVGTAGDYQPMSFLDPSTGSYVGFDAALAEDLGLAGCLVVLSLWALVFARGTVAAVRRAETAPTEALLATGIVASLAVQLVLNVAGVLNALPMTGITLPLISLGGSSQATVLVMCGVLVGVSGNKDAA